MAYLYRHIRLDINEPFYIGIGSDDKGKYIRANDKSERNKWWKLIYKKSKIRIEILLDNYSWEDICVKEKEFIKLYGRRDLNLGPLVNLTDGGDGVYGRIMSNKLKKQALLYKAIPVYQYDLEGKFIKKWKSTAQAANALNIDRGHICSVIKGVKQTAHNFIFKHFKAKSIPPSSKVIYQYDLNWNFIKKWNSTKEAADALKTENIYKALENKIKKSGGFKWSRTKI